ncbi:MAG TPA: nucleotide disphospho-sugar-binding domain-containing protein [Micromonosporaceae bacterium]|nr:nucleotide disphospho-sugar-binding domain-containing protein [Micromonosporaceae bacterium]
MRVLFTTWAWPSHLYALVPLAWACRAAGHDVVVASQPALLDDIVATGLPAVAVGVDVDAVEMVRGYVLPSAANSGGDGQAPRTGRGPRVMQMFLANAESMVDGLVDLAKSWRPDVVVYEPTALAGPVAAAAVGVPAVRHLYGTDLMVRARPMLPDLLAPLAARHGVSDLEPFGAVTVDPTPPSLAMPADYRRVPMRYVPFNGPGAVPAPLPERAGRPRVCVTWGHTMARLAPDYFLAGEVVSALRGTGVEVVAVVSAGQRPLLGAVDDGVRVLVDVPLQHVVGDCDLVVAHGGAGTVLTALHAGVPMLLVPQLPDHAGHAARVLAAGAGEVLTRDEATAGHLRDEIERLLASGPPRASARRVQEEMRSQPSPAAVVADVELLVSSGAGRPG